MIANSMRFQWEHAHQCRRCGALMRINDIDPHTISLGIITCSQCEMSGPINVVIVDQQLISEQADQEEHFAYIPILSS